MTDYKCGSRVAPIQVLGHTVSGTLSSALATVAFRSFLFYTVSINCICNCYHVIAYIVHTVSVLHLLYFRIAYNQLACAQLYTRECYTADLSPIVLLTQEVEDLLGYECSQLSGLAPNNSCAVRKDVCEGVFAIDYCYHIWFGAENVCL